ncbi:MAG TPA: hypothetical protein VHI13_08960 [Candidatus Kapabacteria bacterium]|nr:hypothetical protein [Candidatus Kapabacteria bacterium]
MNTPDDDSLDGFIEDLRHILEAREASGKNAERLRIIIEHCETTVRKDGANAKEKCGAILAWLLTYLGWEHPGHDP